MDFDEVREKKLNVEIEIARLITEFGRDTDMLITDVNLETNNFIHHGESGMIFDYRVNLDVRF